MGSVWLFLATLALASTWEEVASLPDGSFLASLLPRETFIIRDTRFMGSERYPPRRIGGPQPTGIFSEPNTHRYTARRPIAQTNVFQPNVPANVRQPAIQTNVRVPGFSQPQTPPSQQNFVAPQPPRRSSAQQAQHLPNANQGNQEPSALPGPSQQGTVSAGSLRRKDPKCGVLPPSGDCRGAFPRYYYNKITDQCDCFLFGGCGETGLEYSYRNLKECQASCSPSNLEEGPVCKELFREEEFFFHPPPSSHPTPVFISNQQPPNPGHQNVPDDVFLTILLNSVSPENLVNPRDNQQQ